MRTTEIEYTINAQRYVGYLAEPDGAADPNSGRPGVLVFHEGPGLREHPKNVARRLADLGYVAFAGDYIGDGRVLVGDEMSSYLQSLMTDADAMRRLGQGGLDVLLSQVGVDSARIAALGYCFGGTMAIELGRSGADLKAIMGFHSGLRSPRPEDTKQIVGQVLVYLGADDPIIPPEQRAEWEEQMRAGGVDWRMYLHGGVGHSFTNPDANSTDYPGIKYDANADQRSWRVLLDLLGETVGR